ncbi:hypothetical protein T484DRAFT_1780430 [Baffinella frigidus]|nr:hypothetical protein T484DRAFT_1780430 [Cryptophyta sp. CCMP2293]
MENSEMQALTDTISEDVLAAMRQLVDTVVGKLGVSEDAGSGVEVVQEISSATLAQLCMWQLVVGYNLREIEARESLNNRLPESEA